MVPAITAATPPMSVSPVSQLVLRDIHLPPMVSWWPPAPGWWILLVLLIVLTAGGLFTLYRYRRRYFQRVALRQLNAIEQQLHRTHDNRLCTQEISKLLRHMAVLHYAPELCAGLYGENWLNFLDQHFIADKKNSGPFSCSNIGKLLVDSPYRPPQHPSDQSDGELFEQTLALIQLSRRWMKKLPLASHHGRAV